jgi:DNA-binding GntR family transcriptional regulator
MRRAAEPGAHRPEDAGVEHAEILDCIEAGNTQGAREAVERDTRRTGECLVVYGRSLEWTADCTDSVLANQGA